MTLPSHVHCDPLFLKTAAPGYWLFVQAHTHTHTHRDFSPPQFHKYPKDTIDPPAAAEVEESDAVTKAVTA